MEPFRATGTVQALHAQMLDVSKFGDEPGSRHVPGSLTVDVMTGAGTLSVNWQGAPPEIGDRVIITVTRAT